MYSYTVSFICTFLHKKMKITCILLFLIPIYLFGQNDLKDIFSLENQILFDTSIFIEKPNFKNCNKKLYVAQSKSFVTEDDGSGDYLYILDLNNKSTIALEIDDNIKRNDYLDFYILNNNVWLLSFTKIYHYTYSPTTNDSSKVIVKNPKIIGISNGKFDKIERLNDSTLMFYKRSLFSYIKREKSFYYSSFNIKNSIFSELKYLHPPKGFVYSNFEPRKTFTVMNDKVYSSDIVKYKIYVIDTKSGSILDSFGRNNMPFEMTTENQILLDTKVLSASPKSDIISMGTPFYEKVFMVQNLFTLNDSMLVTMYSLPKPKNDTTSYLESILYLDIWKRKNTRFELIVKDIRFSAKPKVKGQSLYEFSTPVDFSIKESFNGYCATTETPFSVKDKIKNNLTYEQYSNEIEEYFKENSITYSLLIYKLNEAIYSK